MRVRTIYKRMKKHRNYQSHLEPLIVALQKQELEKPRAGAPPTKPIAASSFSGKPEEKEAEAEQQLQSNLVVPS